MRKVFAAVGFSYGFHVWSFAHTTTCTNSGQTKDNSRFIAPSASCQLPSRSARKSWRFRTPLVRWRCAASLCEVFVPCVSRSAGVSGHFCFGCLGRSGSWSHWWCGGSWRVGARSVCDGVPLGGLGGEPLGFGTTLPGPGRRWLSLSVRRRCWGRRVASPGRRRLRLGRWLSAAVALVTWRLARSLHFVACRWHHDGRSTPEQQSSGAAERRNGAAAGAPGRWSVGALGCWSLGARSAGMLVRWGGRAVGRRSAGAAGGRSGWALRQWGVGATGRPG